MSMLCNSGSGVPWQLALVIAVWRSEWLVLLRCAHPPRKELTGLSGRNAHKIASLKQT
jgi:hypothetical protein